MVNYAKSIELSELFLRLASKSNKDILKKIESLETFKDRIDFAEKNLKHLSSGSARTIYDLGNGKVLKLASNEKGLAQNESEWKVKDKSKYINRTTSKGKDFIWITAPLAQKLTEREFQDLTNLSFKDFGECIKYMMRELSTKERKKPENFEDIKDHDLIKDVVKIGLKHKMLPGDIARISSWKQRNGVPVLVDLGLSSKIYKEYYSSSSSKSKST